MEKYIEKANYCLSCINKLCISGCPLNNDITGFIKYIKKEDYKSAFELLCETSCLMPICGRVCPHSKQCEGKCIRGIKSKPVQIGELEVFIGDLAIKNNWKLPIENNEKNFKVAIIGGGPAGLTCAYFLRKEGIKVTIFEKYGELGGILQHGIPDFRLDKKILNKWICKILDTGIDVKYNMELGKEYTLDDLKKEYDAIFLSFGANVSSLMNIQGEDLNGVYGGNEFLENKLNLNYTDKTVIINGGGNVAMDVSRTVKRCGAKKVIVIYRRSENEMPAEKIEIQAAKEEGIEFLFQTNILEAFGTDKLEKIECIKTELIKRNNEDRLSPVNIEGSNFVLNCDYLIMAIGSKTQKDLVESLGLDLDKRGFIKIDEDYKTSSYSIYAGGDLVGNKATVAFAARSGRNGAKKMIDFLENKM